MKLLKLNVDEIKPNPYQPREKFDEDKIQELADNIKAHGLIEPIVVTKMKDTDQKYTIVAGERRWRASKLADIKEIYAIHKEYVSDADIKRDSLVENEIRENLSPKEFREFCESLARSLGEPYWTKDGIKSYQLTKYILQGNGSMDDSHTPMYKRIENSKFRKRLGKAIRVEKTGVKELKDAVEEEKISLDVAAQIASIPDKQTQRTMTAMAAAKDHKQLAAELKRYNIRAEYENSQAKAKVSEDKTKHLVNEDLLLVKIEKRIGEWTMAICAINDILTEDKKFMNKFSQKGQLVILDKLKPLRKETEKFIELMSKSMELIADDKRRD